MIAPLHNHLRAIASRFNPSPRERAALAAVTLVLGLIMLSFCYDWSTSAYDRASIAAQSRATAARDLTQVTTPRAREQIGLAAGKIWSWSITEPSETIGEARAAGELEDLARNAGMSDVAVERLAARDEVRGPNGFRSIDLRLTASFDWRSFEALLAAMQQSEISATPLAADVNTTDGQARLQLVVRVPFLPESAT